jgi:hypothetical protein
VRITVGFTPQKLRAASSVCAVSLFFTFPPIKLLLRRVICKAFAVLEAFEASALKAYASGAVTEVITLLEIVILAGTVVV